MHPNVRWCALSTLFSKYSGVPDSGVELLDGRIFVRYRVVLNDHSPNPSAANALVLFAEIAGMAGFEVHRLTDQFDQFLVGTVVSVTRETALCAARIALAPHRVKVDIIPTVVAPRRHPALALCIR